MQTHLHREIESLKKRILAMGAEVEELLYRAMDSLEKRDVKLAQSVVDKDPELDQLEVEIEEDCLKILALHQPVAIDLRYVIAVLKINNDLERIGDLGVNIAERAGFLAAFPRSDLGLDFRGMANLTQNMVKQSLDALVNNDTDLARHVRVSDDEVDEANRQMYHAIEEHIRKNPESVSQMLNYLSVARHLERIADGATNIAEDVIYMVEGEIVRHKPEELPQEVES